MFSTVGIPCSCSVQGEIPPCRAMHPPPFNPNHRLSDWPDCVRELRCRCGRITTPAIRLLRERCGRDPSFAELLSRLRCQGCGAPPPDCVWLCAGYHRDTHGGPEVRDWAVVLRRW